MKTFTRTTFIVAAVMFGLIFWLNGGGGACPFEHHLAGCWGGSDPAGVLVPTALASLMVGGVAGLVLVVVAWLGSQIEGNDGWTVERVR